MRMARLLPGLLLLLLLAPTRLPAEDGGEELTDESTPAYRAALELQRRGRFHAAKKAFERLIAKYPESVHLAAADVRSGDNAYLGTTRLHTSGPAARRIDVSVMGDGFTIEPKDQKLEENWAKLCLEVLWNERVFDEYRSYFNFYFVRLASLEEGVDPNLSEAERAKIEERNRRRVRKRKTDFSTALDCKAAGPQGQVMSDPGLVRKWLAIAEEDLPGCGDDGQVIAFARFGKLGMAGGGIANVGRPDKSITVHEFGHSFGMLADEYAINPGPPRGFVRGPNVAMTDDPDEVPWSHFLKKRVKGVGIFEGGGTYKTGAWRPAASCAMNSAGNTAYCPVCREATVLAIYRHVSPIDLLEPAEKDLIEAEAGGDEVLTVTPMRPRRHRLEVGWHVLPIAVTDIREPTPIDEDDRARWRFPSGGSGVGEVGGRRHREDRDEYREPPPGEPSRLGKVLKGKRGRPDRHVFPLGKLEPGAYRITVEVRDPTPWVLLDPKHLLEDRATWTVLVVDVSE
jgi:hypothetical protein